MALCQRKNRLGFFRKVRGLTQADLAKHIGVSQGTISNWELDIGTPRRDQAHALASLLGVNVRELFPYILF